MLSRLLRFAILLAVVAAIVEALRRMAQPDAEPSSAAPTPWTPLEPTPGQGNGSSAGPTEPAPWVDADADGACPPSHPLKAKDSSKIVHQPGGLSYERTHADRCYVDLAAAEADGYRAAKR